MSSFIAYSLKSNFIEFKKFYAEKIDLDEKFNYHTAVFFVFGS